MKKIFYIFIGCVICFILGVSLSIPFNYWYTNTFVNGEDGVGLHMWVSILLIWPIFLVLGGWLGYRQYSKNVVRCNSGTPRIATNEKKENNQ